LTVEYGIEVVVALSIELGVAAAEALTENAKELVVLILAP
jgi:hypothetical protein